MLMAEYNSAITEAVNSIVDKAQKFIGLLDEETADKFNASLTWIDSLWENNEDLAKKLNGQIEQTKACGVELVNPIGAWLLVHVELAIGARQGVRHKEEIARRQRGDEIVDVLRGDVLHHLNAGDQIDRRPLIRLVGKIVEDQRIHGMLHVVRHTLKADNRDVMLIMNVVRQMATSGADIEDSSHAEAA